MRSDSAGRRRRVHRHDQLRPSLLNQNDPKPRIALDAKLVYSNTKTTVMKVAK